MSQNRHNIKSILARAFPSPKPWFNIKRGHWFSYAERNCVSISLAPTQTVYCCLPSKFQRAFETPATERDGIAVADTSFLQLDLHAGVASQTLCPRFVNYLYVWKYFNGTLGRERLQSDRMIGIKWPAARITEWVI